MKTSAQSSSRATYLALIVSPFILVPAYFLLELACQALLLVQPSLRGRVPSLFEGGGLVRDVVGLAGIALVSVIPAFLLLLCFGPLVLWLSRRARINPLLPLLALGVCGTPLLELFLSEHRVSLRGGLFLAFLGSSVTATFYILVHHSEPVLARIYGPLARATAGPA